MNIVYDHQIFCNQQYGGISRYIYEIASEIATTHHQNVNILALLYINHYLRQNPKQLRILGLPIKRIPKTGRIVQAINWFFAVMVTKHLQPAIVHETYYSSSRIAPKNAKVILTVYDMIHEKFKDQFPVTDRTSDKKRLAVKRADHVICISEQTRRDLIELFDVPPAKISVVYLGFSLTNQEQLPTESPVSPRPFLFYVGDRRGYKNFNGLLQAYAASSALKNNFDLICFGGGKFSKQEQGLILELGLAPDSVVQISGDDALLARYYKSATAFIYPSLYEGFGIPPLEAMSFNCPVICSGVSSIPEIVGNAAEMFDPYNQDSIRTTVERVVSDNILQKTLIARGQERLKLFSWQRCARETLDVYHRVLL